MSGPNDDDATRTVPDDGAGARVDGAVARLFGLSTRAARRLCEARRVRVDGRIADKGDRVAAGAVVSVAGGTAWGASAHEAPAVVALQLLHQDDELLVINKRAGQAVHPLVPGEGGTAFDDVVASFPEVARAGPDAREGGLLHRLDAGTSGCLAFCRRRERYEGLAERVRGGDKRYLAIVGGQAAVMTLTQPLQHDATDRRRMKVTTTSDAAGLSAWTRVTPRWTGAAHTLLEVELGEGRRHQIRAHLAHAGHPLVADALYGGAPLGGADTTTTARVLLHAWRLTPRGGPTVQAPLPPDFVGALEALGCDAGVLATLNAPAPGGNPAA